MQKKIAVIAIAALLPCLAWGQIHDLAPPQLSPIAQSQRWTAADGTEIIGQLDASGRLTQAENTDKAGTARRVVVQYAPTNLVSYYVGTSLAVQMKLQVYANHFAVRLSSGTRDIQATYTPPPVGSTTTVVHVTTLKHGGSAQNFTLANQAAIATSLQTLLKQNFPRSSVEAVSVFSNALQVYVGPSKNTGRVFKVLFAGTCAASAFFAGPVAIPVCMLAQLAADQVDADSGEDAAGPGPGGGPTGPAGTPTHAEPKDQTPHPDPNNHPKSN